MDINALDTLGIYELRDLARKIGVFNPTTLKKAELIKQIMDISNGVTKPYVPKTKQGRPPKEIKGYESLVNILMPSDTLRLPTYEECLFENKNKDRFKFQQNNFEITFAPNTIFKGYLELLSPSNGLLRKSNLINEKVENTVFVPERFIKDNHLKSGDEILCLANFTKENKPMLLNELTCINSIPFANWNKERANFDELGFSLLNKPIKFNDEKLQNELKTLSINEGSNIFLHCDNMQDSKRFILNFINSVENNLDKVIYLNPLLRDKEYELLKTTKAEIFCASFTESFEQQKRISLLATNRAKRLAEQGKKVLLVIDNASNIVCLDKDNNGELPISKYILSCAKNFEVGSLTELTLINETPRTEIDNTINNVFLNVEDVGLFLHGKDVDINKSYSH